MKKFLILLILFSAYTEVQASHAAGGKIWYEYAGDSQFPHRYDVYLILYRDISGITAPGLVQICIRSSCFSNINTNAPLLPYVLQPGSDTVLGPNGSIIPPNASACVGTNAPGNVLTEAYRYHTTVDLPGPCADIKFSYSLSARNSSDNLMGQDYFYIEAGLNSILGPNTSPRFLNPGIRSFCVGRPFAWSQAATEPDGDSLYYEFGNPQKGQCTSPANIPYQQGYSVSSPMTTANGITINHATGMLAFTPSQPEVVVINIRVKEYRINPNLGLWLLAGSSLMDVMIPVVSGCTPMPGNWIQPFQGTPGTPGIACGDSIIKITTQDKFIASSLAADGSDFAILNSEGNLVPIVAAGVYDPTRSAEVNSFWLKLHDSIYYNDTYTLISRMGNDLNTLVNICSEELAEGDSIPLVISSCNTGIGVNEVTLDPEMHLYPNPVKNSLTVKFPTSIGSGILEVYDLKGTLVLTQKFTSAEARLELAFLPKGIYLIKATAGQWTQTLRFEKS